MEKVIRVLVVDDSAVVRQALTKILESDPGIKVMGTAHDPFIAVNKMRNEIPDVITLDVEMPRMDGLTFLKKIMSQHPLPVVIISSLTTMGTQTAFKALEYGAVDIITKPQLHELQFFEDSKIRICDVVKAAASARLHRKTLLESPAEKRLLKSELQLPIVQSGPTKNNDKVVLIGASTGGTEAITEILTAIPLDSPGILIVQHMPEKFTRSFADRLNDLCKIQVKEAENGDVVMRGRVLIAPGNKHMSVIRNGSKYIVNVQDGPLVNRHRPSVDVLFKSAAKSVGKNAVGVILTGMGGDGAEGLLEMRNSGAFTIAQDEKSCIVFGMPKEAIKLNAVDKILPLDKVATSILSLGSS